MFQLMAKQMKKNKKGFTLIELIVVIAIIGILAIIMIPRFTGFRETANEGAVRANLKTMDTAIVAIAAEKNIAETAVTRAQVVAYLGKDPDGSPTSATYDVNAVSGHAKLVNKPSPYPAAGIVELP